MLALKQYISTKHQSGTNRSVIWFGSQYRDHSTYGWSYGSQM
jgi:endo-1,4-beta-mannosidase